MKYLPVILAAALTASAGFSHATLLGLPDPTAGIVWDTFPGPNPPNFNNQAGVGTSPDFTATLDSVMTQGSITGGGDRIYTGVGGSTAAVNFTIEGTSLIAMDSLTVYLKYTTPAETPTSWDNYFTVTLNGVPTTQVELGGTGEFVGGQQEGVVELTWTGLSLGVGDPFAISITAPALGPGATGHVSIDTIQFVPEPTTAAMLLAGTGLLALSRRRRKS